MSTSSSSVLSSSNSAIFTGDSRYASDFQNIIEQAVAVASLPLNQLTTQETALTAQNTALSTLSTDFTALQTAVSNLDQVMGGTAIGATLSDTNVSATVGEGAVQGNYTVEVNDLGAYTTTMTSDSGPNKVTDPSTGTISSAASPVYTLTVGTGSATQTYTLTPAANTLNDLVTAINTQAGTQVNATVVNVGSSTSPDYRLSIQGTQLGDIPIQLSDGRMNLETQQVQGGLASYQVNGSSVVAQSSSRTVTIAPGLTVELLAQSPANSPTNITLTQQGTPIDDALNSLVTAFNTAVDDVQKQRGTGGGALAGQSIVYDLSSALQQVASYFGGDANTKSLADLGITMDQSTGHMDYDEATFLGQNLDDPTGVATYLGGATTGGFLENATNALNSVLDTTTGDLPATVASVASQMADTNAKIATQQTYVANVQTNLQNQMAAADSAIAAMEQQYNYMSGVFQAMQTADTSYANGL
jgi:flagellar capping protein FliD